MENLFIITTLLSFVAMGIFALKTIIQFVKKDSVNGKKQLKRTGISFVVLIFSIIGFGVTGDSSETASKEKTEVSASKEKDKTKETKESEEEKAAREAEETKVAEEKATKKLAEEKDYYSTNVKNKADTIMSLYDEIWNSLWKPTFEGMGNGSMNVYTAYSNMKTVEDRYNSLYSLIDDIPEEGLSKENKELLAEFKSSMKNAAIMRSSAAEKAQKIFDKGDYSPSSLDKMKNDLGYADTEMISAIGSLSSLESKLGVDRKE